VNGFPHSLKNQNGAEEHWMDIKLNQEQGFQVMSLVGIFDTASAVEAEPEFIKQVGDGSGNFLVDFSDVPFIASTGLRILLKMAQAIKTGGGVLYLCCLNNIVREVFEISGFDNIFNVSDRRENVFETLRN
jgi:stage II sporulation protein AA (anti-sigma F factor antagonist)